MSDLKIAPLKKCHACKSVRIAMLETPREFHLPESTVVVKLLSSRCEDCGVEGSSASQHDENLKRLSARKEHYGPYLLGEDVLGFRIRYGLSLKCAAALLGISPRKFKRIENEEERPGVVIRTLLKIAMNYPYALKEMADFAGVVIPLWPERCEDDGLDLDGRPINAEMTLT